MFTKNHYIFFLITDNQSPTILDWTETKMSIPSGDSQRGECNLRVHIRRVFRTLSNISDATILRK